jgi:molybdopterin/thiamine biosynthesis adenylyltransferase
LYTTFCTEDTVHEFEGQLLRSDIILDCTDNGTSRDFIAGWCRRNNKPYIFASALGFDGQLICITPDTGCLKCAFPDIKEIGDTCTDNGILGSVVNTIGQLQATTAIKYCCGVGDLHLNEILHYSSLDGSFQYFTYNEGKCVCEIETCVEIVPEEVNYSDIYKEIGKCVLFFIITNGNIDIDEIAYSKRYKYEESYDTINAHLSADEKNSIVLLCEYGIKSKEEVRQLRKTLGINRIYSVKHGVQFVYLD